MRLKQLYSNLETFRHITFNNDFSIIVGSSLKKSDTSHNLGKTTVLKLLNYVLFNGSGTFLEYVKQKYPNTVFSIDYVENNNPKSFTRGFGRRKNNEPKEIETEIDYKFFIRTQDELDTDNGFIRPSYKGKEINWKPKLTAILGFDDELMTKKLQLMGDCNQLSSAIQALKNIQSNQVEKEKKIDELREEKSSIEKSIKDLVLFSSENENINKLVNSIDEQLFKIKSSIYEQKTEIRKIETSLEKLGKNQFDSRKVESVFNKVNLYFESQIKHSFEELNTFYNDIYLNRRVALEEKLKFSQINLKSLEDKANGLDLKRAMLLENLANAEAIEIFEAKHKEITEIEKEIAILSQTETTSNITELEKQYSAKQTEQLKVAAELAQNIDESREKFDKINAIYKDIMFSVLGIDSELKIQKHRTGNISFYVQSYNNGTESSQLNGDSAKKLSAAAIDIAIRCVQNSDNGFLAQDGIIDALDKNSAALFITKVKELVSKYDFQYITTALKEKLSNDISEEDIVIELNDFQDSNLLFGFKF